MRVWVGTDSAALSALREGTPITDALVAAESDDEQHEYEALLAASEDGPAVVVAEIDDGAEGITLKDVEALYVDSDGSGDLAWFAAQEIDAVLQVLSN